VENALNISYGMGGRGTEPFIVPFLDENFTTKPLYAYDIMCSAVSTHTSVTL